MRIGYSRVSTTEQRMDSQQDALKQARCDQVFTDVTSEAKTDRPQLEAALDYTLQRDVLIVILVRSL